MGRINPTELAIREIREEIVDDVALVIAFMGAVACLFAVLRDFSVGEMPWGIVVPGAMVLGLFCIRFLRIRVPAALLGGLIVGGLLSIGVNAMRVYGVTAPSSFLVPTGLLLAWMLLGGRVAGSLTLAMSLSFAVVASRVVEGGPLSGVMVGPERSNLAYWLNLGMVQVLVALIIIVTLRKLVVALVRRETLSRHERDRYSGMFEALQDAVFVHSIPDGAVLERNQSAESMFGRTDFVISSDEVGSAKAVFPWTEEDVAPRIEQAKREGPQRFVCRGRKADGTRFWCEATLRVFPVSGSERMVVSVRDVDDKICHQMELQRLNDGLESRVAERTEIMERSRKELEAFSYAVAHDLRSPLRAVNGYGKVLQEECHESLDANGKMYVERIVAGTVRMGNLIDALLELSRIDRTTVCNAPVDMALLARECCEELEMAMRTSPYRGVANSVEWSIGALPDCLSDTELVRQIWANLLSNAFKFSGRTESPRVVVGFEERDDGIWFTVSDNGCGFDMAQADKLFGVFQRLHDNSVEGLGIGLATVKRILQRMDGEIEFEGVPGKGATFRFRPYPVRDMHGESEQDSTSFLVASLSERAVE